MGIPTQHPDPEKDADLRRRAAGWFEEHAGRRDPDQFDVSVFRDAPHDEERDLIRARQRWIQQRWDADLAGLSWPEERGGHGRDPRADALVDHEEAAFDVPPTHELVDVTTQLIAPTLLVHGSADQVEQLALRFARAELLCAQLFSEPGAGSDLAGLATRAIPSGDQWRVDGQKVWSSGAQFADYGLLLARTDPTVRKHAGITAFLLPMSTRGVEVRPIRQMSGGASFCEVFLDDVVLPDPARVGEVGDGWRVATTTLSFERSNSGVDTSTGGSWPDLRRLAHDVGAFSDPVLRQRLADVLIDDRLAHASASRDHAVDVPAAQGSLRKLQWVTRLRRISQVAQLLLGPAIAHDTGAPRSFDWTAHVLGTPGYRIAGGTDEIQRTIIAERLLGLPSGPRADRGRNWEEIPR